VLEHYDFECVHCLVKESDAVKLQRDHRQPLQEMKDPEPPYTTLEDVFERRQPLCAKCNNRDKRAACAKCAKNGIRPSRFRGVEIPPELRKRSAGDNPCLGCPFYEPELARKIATAVAGIEVTVFVDVKSTATVEVSSHESYESCMVSV
jgi:hypothetical protein